MANLYESKKLREERFAIVAQMQEIAKNAKAEDRSFTAEELERWDVMDKDQASLQVRIDSAERIEKAESLEVRTSDRPLFVPSRGLVTQADHENGLRAWALHSSGNDHLITSRMHEGAERCGMNINANSLTIQLRDQTQQSTSATEGGYTMNGSLVQGIDSALKAFGGMRQVSRVIRTENGGPIHWATQDDTAAVGAIVGENTTITPVFTAFGTVTLGAFKYTSGVYPVSLELLQDSQLNISSILSENLGTRLARIQNTHFTTGAGTTLPYGVVTQAAEGVVTADSSSALSYANFVDLYHSVDPAYRNDAAFMMADSTLAAVKKMVDTTGRPLWQASMAAGAPDTILGKPVVVNNDIAAKAATAKCVLFGDFNKYIIRDCSDTVIRVLNERWAETGSVGFVALHRADGVLLNTSAVKYLQVHG